MIELARRMGDVGEELFGYHGTSRLASQPRSGLSGRQPVAPLPVDRRRRGRSLATTRRSASTRAAPDAPLVSRQPGWRAPVTRLAIVGAGYVGLVTGACLAETGIEVVCVDLDRERVAAIADGSAPFHEPGLDELLDAGRGSRTVGDDGPRDGGARRGHVMLAVGTPSRDGAIDLAQVREAARRSATLLEIGRGVSRGRGQEHGRARDDARRGHADPGGRVGQDGGSRVSASGSTPSS